MTTLLLILAFAVSPFLTALAVLHLHRMLSRRGAGGTRADGTVSNESGAKREKSPPVLEPAQIAFISDIHGNLQALEAVLADIDARGIKEIVCLGDIVGYGGNPAECLELVRARCPLVVQGNHDAYAAETFELPDKGEDFRDHFEWTREQIGEEAMQWLGQLPLTVSGDDFEAVHASLEEPQYWEYLLLHPVSHFRHQQMPVCFAGHTHLPKMWIEGDERPVEGVGVESLRPNKKHLVDVGAVGQPRDGNPNACYVIYRRDKQDVMWRRVPYDIEGAQSAIVNAGPPGRNAARLAAGK